jgi:regulator of replication initiation timing
VHPVPWPIELVLPDEETLDWQVEAVTPEPDLHRSQDEENEESDTPLPLDDVSSAGDAPEEFDDGFAVLRELLAGDHAGDSDDADEEFDEVVPAAEHHALVDELAGLQVAHHRVVAALAEETERSSDLQEQLDGIVEEAQAWEMEAIALRADLDEVRAEAESLRVQLENLQAALDEESERSEQSEQSGPYVGPERRASDTDLRSEFERLTQGERRRGLRPRDGGRRRPLRARRDDEVQPVAAADLSPVDDERDDGDHHDFDSRELVMSGWSDRLRDVAASTVTWSDEDLERLRAQ